MTAVVPDYLARMVRRSSPADCGVIAGTVPVVSFGDFRGARVATLGINPSHAEFMRAGRFLAQRHRRLPTLESLGAGSLATLSDSQVAAVISGCSLYFSVNPYRQWFDPLDEVLSGGMGVSYYNGSACHLDLVQWATSPIWRKLNGAQRRALLEDGVQHLKAQLEAAPIGTVVVNGAGVWNQLSRTGLAEFEQVAEVNFGAGTTSQLRVGSGCGVRFVGWTLNLQSSHGVSRSTRVSLAEWLRSVTAAQQRGSVREAFLDPTSVASKAEFSNLLRDWFHTSNAETLGDIGKFGGSALVQLTLGDAKVVLNADTKRAAVAQYLASVESNGADAPWRVLANAKGRVNKVEFSRSGPVTPGWYCYLRVEFPSEGTI